MAYNALDNQIEPIRIYELDENNEFVFIDVISNYKELFFTRDWEGIGSWNLRINLNKPKALQLQQGRYIQVGTSDLRQGIILYTEYQLQQDDKGDYTNELFVKGLEVSSLALYGLTYPLGGVWNDPENPSTLQDNTVDYVGGDAYLSWGESPPSTYLFDTPEGIMYELVNNSRVNNQLFNFQNIPNLKAELPADPIQGPEDNRTFNTRFKVLSDELKWLTQVSGLGWQIKMDISNNEFVFKVVEGVDRSESQSVNDRAIFSLRRGNLRSLTYVQDDITSRNQLLVAGQGEGEFRDFIFSGDYDQTGVSSKMKFVDARDIETIDGLYSRGDDKLEESQRKVTIDLRGFSKKGTSKLDEDYTLGDIVTVEVPEWGLQLDVRIIRIIERVTPNNAGTVELLFGSDRETLEGIIKSSLSEVKNETNR